MKKFTKSLLLNLILFCAISLTAQDIHFSQFYNSPQNLNPALTGIFKGDIRAIGNYRNQWSTVPIPFLTFSGAFDQKIYAKFLGKGFLGVGAIFNYDKVGDGDLSWAQLGLNISYTKPLTDQLFLTGGFQYMLASRSFKPEQLTFGEQWNGDIYDPNSSNKENFNATSKTLNSVSIGLNLHFQLEDTRTKADGGIGIYHINEPAATFMQDAKVTLARKINGNLSGTLQIHPKIDLRFFGYYSAQDDYQETIAGSALQYHLNLQKNKEISIQIGSGFRFGDALIPHIEVRVASVRVGVSYDSNISDFNIATQRRGGPEVSIEYILTKVKPVKVFKACPIF